MTTATPSLSHVRHDIHGLVVGAHAPAEALAEANRVLALH
jgi:hypothetical protein